MSLKNEITKITKITKKAKKAKKAKKLKNEQSKHIKHAKSEAKGWIKILPERMKEQGSKGFSYVHICCECGEGNIMFKDIIKWAKEQNFKAKISYKKQVYEEGCFQDELEIRWD